jgi:hypothetical protein
MGLCLCTSHEPFEKIRGKAISRNTTIDGDDLTNKNSPSHRNRKKKDDVDESRINHNKAKPNSVLRHHARTMTLDEACFDDAYRVPSLCCFPNVQGFPGSSGYCWFGRGNQSFYFTAACCRWHWWQYNDGVIPAGLLPATIGGAVSVWDDANNNCWNTGLNADVCMFFSSCFIFSFAAI